MHAKRSMSLMPRRGMPISIDFLQPDGLGNESVQFQRFNGCTACRAKPHDTHTVPPEVKAPGVSSGIEQRRFLSGARVKGRLSRPFSQRTGNTCKREILKTTLSSRFEGHNVIDVEECLLASLRQATVFATISRAPNNMLPQVLRDEHELTALDRWRVAREDAEVKAVRKDLPNPRPHAALSRSDVFHDPACPTRRAAVSQRPLAVGIWPSRREVRSRDECVSAYCASTVAVEAKPNRPPHSSGVF